MPPHICTAPYPLPHHASRSFGQSAGPACPPLRVRPLFSPRVLPLLLILPIMLTMGSASAALAAAPGYSVFNNGKDITNSSNYIGSIIPREYDGSVYTKLASGNVVTLFPGGNVDAVSGSQADTGDIKNNSVNMLGGTTLTDVSGGTTTGDGAVTGNTVTISGDTNVGTNVYGGSSDGAGAVTGNKVIISNGVIGTQTSSGAGGVGIIRGGASNSTGTGAVSDNHVTITGGSMSRLVGGAIENPLNANHVTNNTVTFSGGTVQGNIYGGYTTGKGNATGNTVTITGTATLVSAPSSSDLPELYGGFFLRPTNTPTTTADLRSGNTLNLGTKITLSIIENFENWNFVLNDSLKNQTMIKMSGNVNAVIAPDNTPLQGKIGLSVAADSGKLNKGDSFTLINKFTGKYSASPLAVQPQQGFVNVYEMNVEGSPAGIGGLKGTPLTATVTGLGRAGGLGNNNTYTVTADDAGLDFVAGGIADGVTASTATGNTLVLASSPGVNTALYGGRSQNLAGDVRTGNTMAVRGLNMSAKNVQNFQNYHFYLPASAKTGDVMLNVAEATDLRGSKVGVGVPASGTGLTGGNSVTLLKSDAGLKADATFPIASPPCRAFRSCIPLICPPRAQN